MKKNIQIKLSSPEVVNGQETSEITMRTPLVKDLRETSANGAGNAEAELGLIARICDIPSDDLDNFTLPNYKKIQQALAENFM